MAAPKHARMAFMLKQSILLAIASGFLTSLCPVLAETNDKSKLVDQPNMLNATPLTLVPATDELYANLTKEQQTEKEEILLLFRLALMKSEAVRNLLKKMYPSGDREKTEAFLNVLIKTLSTQVYTGIGSMALTEKPLERDYPGPDYSIRQISVYSSFHVFYQVVNALAKSANYKLTDQEAREFYKSVRPLLADAVAHYRDYKVKRKQLHTANQDFEDLKKMIAESKNLDASKQIEMEYTLRKLQKDIDEICKTFSAHRKFLVELAGEDAVQKIDINMIGEYTKAELNKFPPSKGKISESSSEPHSESAQLRALWQATLKNSPDINFVLAKLAPSADSSKLATILIKSPGTGTMSLTDPYLEPGYPQSHIAEKLPSYKLPARGSNYRQIIPKDGTASDASLNQNLSINVFSQLLDSPENARNKKAKVSQEEQIMLYNMIRTTAKQLISAYRDYKIAKDEPSKSKCRQLLVDLAGNEAVDKLDEDIQVERM